MMVQGILLIVSIINEGVNIIASDIKVNRTLQKLDIANNHIRIDGRDAIRSCVGCPLKELKLSWNEIKCYKSEENDV